MSSLVCSGAPSNIMLYGTSAAPSPTIPNTTTADVTTGSPNFNFSDPVSLPAGTPLTFAVQPYTTPPAGSPTPPAFATLPPNPPVPAVYNLAADLVSATAATLTKNYTGPPSIRTNVNVVPSIGGYQSFLALGTMLVSSLTIAATAHVNTGIRAVVFSAPVVLPAGTALTFSDDPGSTYYLESAVNGTAGLLTTPYEGTTDVAATVTNVTCIVTVSENVNPAVVTKSGQAARFVVKPFGSYAPTDTVLFFPPAVAPPASADGTTVTVTGINKQPATLVGIPANLLVP